MADDEPTRRTGRAALIDAAADLLATTTLDDVTAFLGPRAIARRADVAVGTVSYHFPAQRDDLVAAALERAFTRAGGEQLAAVIGELEEGASAFAATGVPDPDSEGAIDRFLEALADHLRRNAPAEPATDGRLEARETALFLAAAVGPRDPRAAGAVRSGLATDRATREALGESLLRRSRRRWRDGVDTEIHALGQEALIYGFLLIRRLDIERGRPDVYAAMSMRLFDVCTEPVEAVGSADYRDSLATLFRRTPLGSDEVGRLVAAAIRVYGRHGWSGLTTTAVAEEAGLPHPVVVGNLRDRRGLAAAVWSGHAAMIAAAAERERGLPVHVAVRTTLERLCAVVHRDVPLTVAFYEGTVAYAVEHGPPSPDDLVDPRHLAPLSAALLPALDEHEARFRPEFVSSPEAKIRTGKVLVGQALQMALLRLATAPDAVAHEVVHTTLAGMLRRRPPGLD